MGGTVLMERGAFDVRVWVEGEDGRDVYRRMKNLFEEMQLLAGQHEGCDVRYQQLRPRNRSRHPDFEPTLPWSKAQKDAARAESEDFSRPAVPLSNPET
jgi:hypothetical protein